MTKDQAIEEHRKLWDWLSENPGAYKRDYFAKYYPDNHHLMNNCFLCAYLSENYPLDERLPCSDNRCILVWPNGGCQDSTLSEEYDSAHPMGLFDEWEREVRKFSPSYQLIAELAAEIRDLPVNDDSPY